MTGRFLDVLSAKRVKATFFVLGQQVARYPKVSQRIVGPGHEIANHSWAHSFFPSAADLRSTNSQIRATTGFRHCTFRPPGGSYNGNVVASARFAGGMATVLWDVDTSQGLLGPCTLEVLGLEAEAFGLALRDALDLLETRVLIRVPEVLEDRSPDDLLEERSSALPIALKLWAAHQRGCLRTALEGSIQIAEPTSSHADVPGPQPPAQVA